MHCPLPRRWLPFLSVFALACTMPAATAQVIPDATLGAGNNSATTTAGDRTDITGGLRRNSALFHSFDQFSVLTNHQVYFANPSGIRNIFSRVTGSNLSNIDGTLGVAGAANLFLINPNGIIFGPNARLDVSGSFFATTANALEFPDNQRFAATGDRAVPLVEVNIPIGVQFGANPPAMIRNQGNLAAGQNLTLAASDLDLQGQLRSGGNLTLNATDTVRIRDTTTEPFLARSGGDMTIQGNQGIDILALNHLSQTPFVSGGNMSLISDGIISGDAHFSSSGSFQIRSLSGQAAIFTSLYDPIISSAGNVDIAGGYGTLGGGAASLLIESQGNVRIQGDIFIETPDTTSTFQGADTILRSRPGLIIRSGQTNLVYGGTNQNTPPPTFTNTPNIPIGITLTGNVTTLANSAGTIDLSAQSGDISTKDIIATSNSTTFPVIRLTSTTGSVILDNATLSTSNTNATALSGAGDIFINAANDIRIINGSSIESNGDFGRIFLNNAQNVTINKSSLTAINTSTATSGTTGGQISINAPGNATTPGTINITQSSLRTPSSNSANGGRIGLTVGNAGTITTNSSTLDASISGTGAVGNGVTLTAPTGNINIDRNSLITTATTGGTATTAPGSPINITATGGTVTVRDNSTVNATTSTAGSGGRITLSANAVTVTQSSLVNTTVQSGGSANGGDIAIIAGTFSLTDGGRVQANTFASGNAGNIQLTFTDTATIAGFNQQSFLYSGMLTETRSGATGTGGTITINSPANLQGNLAISDGGFLSARTLSSATGGNIEINVNNLRMELGGQVLTTSSSSGNAGSIAVNAAGDVRISGSRPVPTAPVSPFTNPDSTPANFLLNLDGLAFNNANNPNVEASGGAGGLPFISLQRNPNGQSGRIFASQNASGDAVTSGTNLGPANNFDYYSFSIRSDGSQAIFDIDNAVSSVPGTFIDTELFLFDALTGQLLARNDDFFPTDTGSSSLRDSRISYNFNLAGRYILGVGRFSSSPNPPVAATPPLAGTPLVGGGDPYRLQVSLQNQGTGNFNLADRNPNQGLNSGLFSNVQPPANLRTPGSGVGNDIRVTTQAGQIDLSNGAVINASTAGLGSGGNVLLQTGGGPVSITSGARVETRTTGVGNFANYSGNAGNITIDAPNVTVSGSNQVNGQPVFSGLLASSDTAKSGVGGAISINRTIPGNSLLVENGAFLSTLNRSDQDGQGIEVNVGNLQLLNGGQIITAAEGLGRAGGITINSANVQISGTNSSFVAPPALPNGSGNLPWISGGQTIDPSVLSSTPNPTIDFSSTVPHVTIQGQGGAYDFYRLDNVVAGNRVIADIDNQQTPGGGFDTELFLFDSAGNLLTRNDDSRVEPGRGSGSGLDSYIDYTFSASGTYYVAVGRFSSNPVLNQVPPNQALLTGTVPTPTDRYTLSLSVDRRNTFNPNSSPSSGLFAQSTAVGGAAGSIQVNGGGAGTVTLQNGAQISGSTVSGTGDNITLAGLNTLQITNSLISASTTGNGGTAGSVNINASQSVTVNGTLPSSTTSPPAGGISTQATNGNGSAGSVTISTPQLTVQNGAAIAASTQSGVGQDITLTNLNTLQLDNGTIAASTVDGVAGNLFVNNNGAPASSISLSNQSLLSLAATGTGSAGQMVLNTQQLTLQNSRITASTNSGVGRDIQLNNLNTLQLDNGTIAASTVDGVAGNLFVNDGGTPASSISLSNQGLLSLAATGTGSAGRMVLNTQQLTLQNSRITASTNSGVGRDIQLNNLNTLQLDNGTIEASTNTGVAGNITALVSGDINLTNDSRISTQATGVGARAGSVTIAGRRITVQGSIVQASSQQGPAGFLQITADRVNLNRGQLLATTGQNDPQPTGITLRINNRLILENESLISTLGTNGANGGNISILNVRFLFGRRPTGPNGSDIVGRADGGGRGGRVFLDRKTLVQGFLFRRAVDGNRTNDIDTNGQLDNFSTDADVGARGLSSTLLIFNDVSQVVRSACDLGATKTAEINTELKISGRGGVPISPTVPLPPQDTASDWVSLELRPQVPIALTLPDGRSETLRPGEVYELQATCVRSWLEQQRSPLAPLDPQPLDRPTPTSNRAMPTSTRPIGSIERPIHSRS